MLPIDVVYFSNYSGNTKRFVERLDGPNINIPIDWNSGSSLTSISLMFFLYLLMAVARKEQQYPDKYDLF